MLTNCTHVIRVYVVFFLLALPALLLPRVGTYVGNGTRPPGYEHARKLPEHNGGVIVFLGLSMQKL